jgi:SAM-dependent methyltransferase
LTALEVMPLPVRHSVETSVPYQHLPSAERYVHKERDEALLALLERHGIESLAGLTILELGCGSGSLLQSLLAYGAEPRLLTGIDLDFRRVRRARNATGANVAVADGALLPYRAGAFDLVFVFTALSSMHDVEVRRHAAHEAMRVLRPGGLAVVYDFWINPFNSAVRPISAAEVAHIFEPEKAELERVTLAPPIVRLFGGNERICRALGRLSFLRTHLLAAIGKEAEHV